MQKVSKKPYKNFFPNDIKEKTYYAGTFISHSVNQPRLRH